MGLAVLRRLRASSRSTVTLALFSGSGLGGNRKGVKTGTRMEVRTGFREGVGTRVGYCILGVMLTNERPLNKKHHDTCTSHT